MTLQVAEAVFQLLLQSEATEQGLEHHQAGEGGQFLGFKLDVGIDATTGLTLTTQIGYAARASAPCRLDSVAGHPHTRPAWATCNAIVYQHTGP